MQGSLNLTYIPTSPPTTPFVIGDKVEVLDREHAVLSVETVTKVFKRKIKTSCGREWTLDGAWFDGEASYPFPSIRKHDTPLALQPLEAKPSTASGETDLREVLKQRVEAGETIFITGGGSSAGLESTIKDLAREAGKTVRVVQTVTARVVQFGERDEIDDGGPREC